MLNVEVLCHGILERMGRESDTGSAIIEFYMCLVIPECRCMADELGKLLAIKIDLMEEGYIEVMDLRGINVGHEVGHPLNI